MYTKRIENKDRLGVLNSKIEIQNIMQQGFKVLRKKKKEGKLSTRSEEIISF